jgi:hypothetical protein
MFAYIPEPKGQAKLSKVNFVGVLRSLNKNNDNVSNFKDNEDWLKI